MKLEQGDKIDYLTFKNKQYGWEVDGENIKTTYLSDALFTHQPTAVAIRGTQ